MRSVHPVPLVGIAGLAAAALMTAPAYAAPAAPAQPGPLATTLAQQLGGRTAGSYLSGGKLIVTVSDGSAAKAVREAGAVPKVVERSGSALKAVTAALDRDVTVAGTAWGVSPQTNQVLLSVDSTVTGAKLAKVRAAAAKHGSAVRIERVAGTFRALISGGDAIYTSSARCSLGFNVVSGSTYYFLTAGHCTNIGSTWWSNSSRTTTLGTRAGTSFPGNDYGIVRYTNTSVSHPGQVGSQDITSAANPVVGQTVTRRGSTTGVRSGTVTALNQTVRYAEGSVGGMIRTTVCAEPGDSGGPLYAGSTALGLTSGGNGNCSTGGTTFFQPVTEPLSVYGVSVF